MLTFVLLIFEIINNIILKISQTFVTLIFVDGDVYLSDIQFMSIQLHN